MFVKVEDIRGGGQPALTPPKLGRKYRVALICMPWGAISRPSLALGILKQCLMTDGFSTDVHYFNVDLASRIGLDRYQAVADYSGPVPEWFFAQQLFGPTGLDEMCNGWSSMKSNPK